MQLGDPEIVKWPIDVDHLVVPELEQALIDPEQLVQLIRETRQRHLELVRLVGQQPIHLLESGVGFQHPPST